MDCEWERKWESDEGWIIWINYMKNGLIGTTISPQQVDTALLSPAQSVLKTFLTDNFWARSLSNHIWRYFCFSPRKSLKNTFEFDLPEKQAGIKLISSNDRIEYYVWRWRESIGHQKIPYFDFFFTVQNCSTIIKYILTIYGTYNIYLVHNSAVSFDLAIQPKISSALIFWRYNLGYNKISIYLCTICTVKAL